MKISAVIFIITATWFITTSCSPPDYNVVPGRQIYNVLQKQDTLYFTTSNRGIYKFDMYKRDSVIAVARVHTYPFRSMVFTRDNRLLACSYRTTLHYLEGDTLLPLKNGNVMAWSIKLDSSGSPWMAGDRGIYKLEKDTLIHFKNIMGAHDISLFKDQVAVAHAKGITIYDLDSGHVIREYCKDINFWCIRKYRDIILAGGKNALAKIENGECGKIPFGPEANIAWSVVKDKEDNIFMGTQKGLFKIPAKTNQAECIGFSGQCIKTLFIDSNQRLWVGQF
jgi:ligand-binding sensor domain-containing protein